MAGIVVNSGLLSDCIKQSTRRVLLVFQHGLGDVLSFISVFQQIKKHWPDVFFDIGLNKSMGYEKIVPEAILISRVEEQINNYDLIFVVKYRMEDFSNPSLTKAEKCCIEEIGIPPLSYHVLIKPPPLVGVHFNSTCMPKQIGCSEQISKTIWNDIISCGCCPIETHFLHKFHNPENEKFKFVDMNCRSFCPKIDSLSSVIGSCFAFVGVISGNLHLALSILPPEKIFILTNRIKTGHVTKLSVSNIPVNKYKDEIKGWLNNLLHK